jgi:TonB family protein
LGCVPKERNAHLFFLLFASFLISIACAKHPIQVAVKPPEASSGVVSFKFLAQKDSGERQNPKGWEYHPPYLIGEAVLPSYPERPLANRFGSAVVIVRIAINSAGEVTDVSLKSNSSPGPFAADFFHSVETTVRKWRFTRPEWWLLEQVKNVNGEGTPDYQKVIDIKPASASGDAEFLFELVGGQGKVRER